MTSESPGARAVSALEISDIFVVASNCRIAFDFNQTELIPRVAYQHRISPQNEVIGQTRKEIDSGTEINVIRYLIDGGLRILRPGVEPPDSSTADVDEDKILAEIVVKIAVDYICPKEMFQDRDAIGAFSKNAIFHAWPYWRSMIHSYSEQMRLPRITLPMFRPPAAPPTDLNSAITVEKRPRKSRRPRPKAKRPKKKLGSRLRT
jgi:hypothetical protein